MKAASAGSLDAALRARQIARSTVLTATATKQLAAELGVTEKRLKDAIAQLPVRYDRAIGEVQGAAAERVKPRDVIAGGQQSRALDGLFNASAKEREAALPMLLQGAQALEQIASHSGGDRPDSTGRPIDASFLVDLRSVRDAVISRMDGHRLDQGQLVAHGTEAHREWEQLGKLRPGSVKANALRGSSSDPRARAIGVVLGAVSSAAHRNLTPLDDFMKRPAVRRELVSMLGELGSNPARLSGIEAGDAQQLAWLNEHQRKLAATH